MQKITVFTFVLVCGSVLILSPNVFTKRDLNTAIAQCQISVMNNELKAKFEDFDGTKFTEHWSLILGFNQEEKICSGSISISDGKVFNILGQEIVLTQADNGEKFLEVKP